MAVKKAKYKEEGDRYLGLSTDTKPTEGVALNSIFEELDTGGIFKFNGTSWIWYEAAKALDHNRMMLGLGLSYKSSHRNSVAVGANAVYRFNPGAVGYHHSEARIMKVTGGNTELKFYRGGNPANLPAVVTTIEKNNQKGLDPAERNSLLTFTYHGDVADAGMAAILAGATEVDDDYFFAAPGLGQSGGTPASSALPSGRHYDPDTEYFLVVRPDNGDLINYYYAYFWHEQ